MRNTPPVQFRAARPEDAAGAVPLILASGPDAFDYVFRTASRTPTDFLHHAFAHGGGEFGFRNHIVGELEGRIVAAGAGWSSASNLAFTLNAVPQFLGCYGMLGTPPVIVRGLRAESVIRPPAAGEWCVAHLGVDPALRGQGIGEALVAHLLAAGRAAGAARAILDVAVTNPRAEALYTRLGFTVTAERPSALRRAAGFVPSHRRMQRTL